MLSRDGKRQLEPLIIIFLMFRAVNLCLTPTPVLNPSSFIKMASQFELPDCTTVLMINPNA